MSPELLELIPLEWARPVLQRGSEQLESLLRGNSQHDWLLRASSRAVYRATYPEMRWAFASALRGLAFDPAYGPDGLWTRLDQLAIPAAFIWGDKDHFIGTSAIEPTSELVPAAFQLRVPCAGHFANGPHFECFEDAALEGIRRVEDAARHGRWSPHSVGGTTIVECNAGRRHGPGAAVVHPASEDAGP